MAGCGPDRIEVAPGVTRPVAHDLGNLKVCAEDGGAGGVQLPGGVTTGVGSYYDPVADQVNFEYAFQKIGPEGFLKALAGAGQGLLTGTASTQLNATQASQAALVEQALRIAAGYNLVAQQYGLPQGTAGQILGQQNIQNAVNAIPGLPPLSQPKAPYYGTNEDSLGSLLGYSLGNAGTLGSQQIGQTSLPLQFLPPGSTGGGGNSSLSSVFDFLGTGGNSATFGYGTDSGLNFGFAPSSTASRDTGGLGIGTLLGGALLAGGLGALFGGSDSTSKQTTNVPPPSAAELQLLGINSQLALAQLSAYQQQLGQQGTQNNYLNGLLQQQFAPAFDPVKIQQAHTACDARHGAGTKNAQDCFNSLANIAAQQMQQQATFDRAQQEKQRQTTITQQAQQQDQLGQLALTEAQQGTQPLRADQLALLQGAADNTISSGLSDLQQFRDSGLDAIRQASAVRGLRPTDTPIQNQFHDLSTDAQRQAQNFVQNVRAQQLNSQLTLPYQEAQVRNAGLGLGADLAAKRQALQETLAQQSDAQRFGLLGNTTAAGLGLATGLNPAGSLGALTAGRTANTSTTATQNPSLISQLGPVLGGIGGLLGGLGQTGLLGSGGSNPYVYH